MKKNIITKTLSGFLIILCIVWIVLGIIYITKIQIYALQHWVIMVLMILDGICFGVFAYFVNKKLRFIYIILLLFVIVNAILTVTDQVGILDWLVLLLNLSVIMLSILGIVVHNKRL